MSPRLAVFGGFWPTAIGDVEYLICHLTSRNHVIQGSSNFMSESFSWYVTTLRSLEAICIVVVDKTLVFHVIQQGHVVKWSDDYNDRNLGR